MEALFDRRIGDPPLHALFSPWDTVIFLYRPTMTTQTNILKNRLTMSPPNFDFIPLWLSRCHHNACIVGGGGQIDHRCMCTMLRPLPFLMEILALGLLNLLYKKVQCSLDFRNFSPGGKLCFPRRHISLLNDAERKCAVERRVH